MAEVKLIIHKDITADTAKTTWAVTMRVVEALGVTPNIFVVQYTPYSKYTGPATYVYSNVAYLDELISIPDKIQHSNKACRVRKSEFTHRFITEDACKEFISEVEMYLKRLVIQLEGGLISEESTDITVTKDGLAESPCTTHRDTTADSDNDEIFSEFGDAEYEDSDVTVISIDANGD